MLDGQPISPDNAFEYQDVAYPPNWIRFASPEEREAVGITEVPDPPPVDHRFWYEEGVPRSVEDIQQMFTREIKLMAENEILRAYPDWHQRNVTARGVELSITATTRSLNAEETAEVDEFTETWTGIKALRAHSDTLEAEMMALTHEQLTTWQQHGWPSQDQPPATP